MRLGGLVIHGNSVATLGECLDSLKASCDEVVAVDSGSTDGSAELVRSRGIRAVSRPWRGYGAARAAGAKALAGCDYVMYLDSDESLNEASIAAIKAWRGSSPRLPYYRFYIRDWADLPGRRFVYRHERHVRLFRYDSITWREDMIIHEAPPSGSSPVIEAYVEHRFANSLDDRREKHDVYALLWAIRADAAGKQPKREFFQRTAHIIRDAIFKGALWRGGLDGWRLAASMSFYHQRKHQFLRALQQGEFADIRAAYRERRYEDVLALTQAAVTSRAQGSIGAGRSG